MISFKVCFILGLNVSKLTNDSARMKKVITEMRFYKYFHLKGICFQVFDVGFVDNSVDNFNVIFKFRSRFQPPVDFRIEC